MDLLHIASPLLMRNRPQQVGHLPRLLMILMRHMEVNFPSSIVSHPELLTFFLLGYEAYVKAWQLYQQQQQAGAAPQ